MTAVAWGAFAFGAVYSWAYLPLALSGAVLFALAFASRSGRPASLPLATAVMIVATAIAIQLLPIGLEALRRWSPETSRTLETINPAVAAHVFQRHPLTIDPSRTTLALGLLVANAMFLFGSARLFSFRGVRGFAETLTVVGVVLALAGIVQQPLWNGKIYGVWQSIEGGDTYGPFVNKNHFAGWMLMALPLTLGLVCGRVARGFAAVKPTWRDRFVWLSSGDASRLVLLAAAAGVMALALVLTMSRSGMSAMVLALAVTGAIVARRQRGARRGSLIAYFILLTVLVVSWAGLDAIASRFSAANWDDINGRRGAWMDAVDIASRFPLVGTGLDTYGVATLLYQRHDLEQHYNEAHNDYLQLAAEGGALVVIPAAIAVGCLIVTTWRRFAEEKSVTTYWLRVGAVTGLIAIAFQETVEFSLQMPGNAALFAVLCGIAIHHTPSRKGVSSHDGRLPAVSV